MIQITTTTDLLKAKQMTEQLLKFGRNEVNKEIAKAVNKCVRGLNIEMDNMALQIFIEDIIETYKFDSIEDIQICLKNGRQGKFGKTYGKLNMIVFQGWMAKHLEQKEDSRESEYIETKKDFKDKNDYTEFVLKGLKNQKEIADSKKETTSKEAEYQKFRAEYFNNKL